MSSYGLVYYSVVGNGAEGTLRGYGQALKSVKRLGLMNVKIFPFGEDNILDLLRNGFMLYGQREDVLNLIEDINKTGPSRVLAVPVVS